MGPTRAGHPKLPLGITLLGALLVSSGCGSPVKVRTYEGDPRPPAEVALLKVRTSTGGLDLENNGAWYRGGWLWGIYVVGVSVDDRAAWSRSKGPVGREVWLEILPGPRNFTIDWKEDTSPGGEDHGEEPSFIDDVLLDRPCARDETALGTLDRVTDYDLKLSEARTRRREAARRERRAPRASKTLFLEAEAGHRYRARWVKDDEGRPGDPLLHGYVLRLFDELDPERPLGR